MPSGFESLTEYDMDPAAAWGTPRRRCVNDDCVAKWPPDGGKLRWPLNEIETSSADARRGSIGSARAVSAQETESLDNTHVTECEKYHSTSTFKCGSSLVYRTRGSEEHLTVGAVLPPCSGAYSGAAESLSDLGRFV